MQKNISTFILTLIVLDVLSDIYFLNSLMATEQEEPEEDDTDQHPLIGKRYIVTDNSYAIDKETGAKVIGLCDKEYVIVSDPYMDEVECPWGNKYKHMFVDVFSLRSARKYRVLFQEKDIIED